MLNIVGEKRKKMDKITTELWNSKCEKDSKGNHRFEQIGVIESYDMGLMWRCSQCKKCLIEPLVVMDLDEESFRMSKRNEDIRKITNYFFKQVKDPSKLTLKKFHTILHQVYFLAQEELKEEKKEVGIPRTKV